MVHKLIVQYTRVFLALTLYKVFLSSLPHAALGIGVVCKLAANYAFPGMWRLTFPFQWGYDPLLLAVFASIAFCIVYQSLGAVFITSSSLACLFTYVRLAYPGRITMVIYDAYLMVVDVYAAPLWAWGFTKAWFNARTKGRKSRTDFVTRHFKIAKIDFNFIAINNVVINRNTHVSPFAVGYFYRTSDTFHDSDLLWAISDIEYQAPTPLTSLSMDIVPSLANKYHCKITFNLTIIFDGGRATKYSVSNCKQSGHNWQQLVEIPPTEGEIEIGDLSLESILSKVQFKEIG